MNHEILIYNQTRRKIPKNFIKGTLFKILDFLKLKQPVEMAVLIVYPSEIKQLNKIWRKKNYTPEELSFGLNSRKLGVLAKPNKDMLDLGHIVVNVEKIFNKNNLSKLLIHSLLHLLCYNHEKSGAESKKMEHLESKIFKNLNI